MTAALKFSIIVPVYNRPDEVDELLNSLSNQTDKDFEVLIVEDGSTIPCGQICQKYEDKLVLSYLPKPNSGRSETRNYGMERASGNYFIIFDSDCMMPPAYIEIVRRCLTDSYVDCYGGPDAADDSFSAVQKAINYSMTSFMTTGGIRGATKKAESFSPRSFNMGLSKTVFQQVGGYKNMIGEDIDMSIRIKEAGFKTRLFPAAYVYHKRRVDLRKFFRQVNTFGRGRVLLGRMHKGSLKLVHLMPAAFVCGNVFLILLSLIFGNAYFLLPLAFYVFCLFLESLWKNKSLKVALLSILTAYSQLFGYGLGFMAEWINGKASKLSQEKLYK